jgi:hypothetical protein
MMRSHLCGLVPVAQLFGVKAEIHVFTLSAPPPGFHQSIHLSHFLLKIGKYIE